MNTALRNDYSAMPDARGRFGDYGGLYVAETLMPLVLELDRAYAEATLHARGNVQQGRPGLGDGLGRVPGVEASGQEPRAGIAAAGQQAPVEAGAIAAGTVRVLGRLGVEHQVLHRALVGRGGGDIGRIGDLQHLDHPGARACGDRGGAGRRLAPMKLDQIRI